MTKPNDNLPKNVDDDTAVPLESDPADWQEQHQDVPGDPDERR
ncbi:MAG: hypothetical protein U0Q20_04585 [Mycobacterium sp.]|nr:hypothetical protein [Mycobacterium sp.]